MGDFADDMLERDLSEALERGPRIAWQFILPAPLGDPDLDLATVTWTTRDGVTMLVKDIPRGHRRNIWRHLLQRNLESYARQSDVGRALIHYGCGVDWDAGREVTDAMCEAAIVEWRTTDRDGRALMSAIIKAATRAAGDHHCKITRRMINDAVRAYNDSGATRNVEVVREILAAAFASEGPRNPDDTGAPVTL
ncbi:hypothetical protein [Leucobacter sp. cx-169]|uniref:hypothetical protein n=1 Tax=Leucobacter sp. cx-169 TaxID=2770549 RepID=UPI00165D8D9C|nr:hypothetical protein [Leucobacter sp. cx-169]MBC9927294.1 hypothetical protein [Leucobacter sp. cx-169]